MSIRAWAIPLALLLTAAPAAADVRDGVEKWRGGDYKAAVTEWLPFAARGNADALFNMGQAYKLGRGVTANESTALEYYRRAATRGHGPAQEKLGITLYAQPATKPEGLRWLEQAARKNLPRAQYLLGVAYFNGDAVPRNWPLAYAYMLRANNGGVAQATVALATMNANIPINDRTRGEEMVAATTAPASMTAGAPARAMPAPRAAGGSLAVRSAVASPAPASADLAGGWRVQLGAFSQKGLAAEAWAGLKAAQPAVVAGADPIYAEGSNMVRLQVGPFASRDDAVRLCDRLLAAGRSCFVVTS